MADGGLLRCWACVSGSSSMASLLEVSKQCPFISECFSASKTRQWMFIDIMNVERKLAAEFSVADVARESVVGALMNF